MSDSDSGKRWPVVERRSDRKTQERRAAERRAASGGEQWGGPDRRSGERRSGVDRRNESAWQPLVIDPATAVAAEARQALLSAATAARTHAQARYSGFKVGAALGTVDGRIVTGCNIENATYGLTLCAERVALVKALSDGHVVFTSIAVVADTIDPTPPCGSCRQLLWEYCGDIDVILGNLEGPTGRYRLSALLPVPFDARLLG